MEVDNDTNTPVNYDQSGGDGSDEKKKAARPAAAGESSGELAPKGQPGSKKSFIPEGSAPWTVRFFTIVDQQKVVLAEKTGIENPDARILFCYTAEEARS